ncbi:endonuclease/exonuclease/phosphatase family protein [Agrobacterium sp. O3.4]|uniref:Endonuclease/exonuclease/phosphatase family protein n=1 Tax=Agrobacterium cucumeris TaxID=2862866 RepID=A0ABY8RNV4_9HYPH|nr:MULTISPECIES: endonuclease/exonuclease/phosphatase family protein [Rhizobium/Agrobacterium group]MCZ7469460.1 endonuclease/exonuclease/phosphatase family protein [Rhizobium rhizogenes]WHO09285.1 endonuclease/exonuclease/phosphatase family protein [Agrobacterium cucumeris]
MRLICLNGWGGKLHDELVPYLSSSDPDILCLQEVVHKPDATQDWLSYRDHGIDLPQRANFLRDIADALPDHLAVFCPAAQGDLWDGDIRYPSQWGLATFVRRSIAIVAQAQGFVHGTFSADGYGDHPRSRTAHAIRIFDFTTGQPAVIAHMHGLRDPEGKHDSPARLAQAKRLVQLVRNIAEAGDRIIVCGDFSVLPDSETFAVLRELDLTELVTTRGFNDTRTSHYTKQNRYADYMLVNPAVKIDRFDVVTQPEVSDHCPLLLEFR